MLRRRAPGVPYRFLIPAILLPIPVFLVALGAPSLWDPDEGRHAEIARAMLEGRDWLLPHLGGEPYREKLPTYYWLLAGSFWLFGPHEWAARLPSALIGAVGAWLTMAWGARHFGRGTGVLAGVILTTSAGYAGAARLASPDSIYAVALSLAILAAIDVAVLTERTHRWPIPYLWLAFATALRGPIACILAAIVLFPLALRSDTRRRLRPVLGAGIVALAAVPIAAACAWRDPDYLVVFLLETNLGGFFGSGGESDTPLLFYLWILPLLSLPWSVFLPAVLFEQGRLRFRARSPSTSIGERRETRQLLAWWILVVATLFTLSETKHPGYVLPALPPIALLTAVWSTARLRLPLRGPLQDPLLGPTAVLGAVLALAPLAGNRLLETIVPPYADQWIYLLWLIPVAAPGIAAVIMGNRPGALAWIGGSSAAVLLSAYVFGADAVSALNSLETPAHLVVTEMPAETRLLSYRSEAHSLSFYSRRSILELDNAEAGALLLDGAAPAALLTKDRHLGQVGAAIRKPLYIWWVGESRKVLLANQPRRPGDATRILLPGKFRHGEPGENSSFGDEPSDGLWP